MNLYRVYYEGYLDVEACDAGIAEANASFSCKMNNCRAEFIREVPSPVKINPRKVSQKRTSSI